MTSSPQSELHLTQVTNHEEIWLVCVGGGLDKLTIC